MREGMATQGEQLARQGEQIARLQREKTAEKKAAARALPPERPLRLSEYIHVDAVPFRESSEDEVNGSTGEPLNENRFLIRRARLRGDAVWPILSGVLELDANTVNGPTARIIDAEISARWASADRDAPPYVMATVGLFKIPFGREVLEPETARLFLERSSVIRALFPGNYDLGVRLQGGFRFLRYAFAAMNGAPIGERQFPGRDPEKSKELVGRVGVHTAIVRGIHVQAGFSGLGGHGFHEGTPSTKDVLVWRDANENGLVEGTEIQVIAGSAATASETFERFGLGGDARFAFTLPLLGELAISGEIVWATNLDRGIEPADPVSAGRDLRELGWHVGLTQEVTRYGMVGVRYDRYDPDADASEQQGKTLVPRDSTLSTVAIAGAVRYPPARLIVEYDHNTNAYGRSAGGEPTTLADDALTLRAEMVF